MQEVGTTHSIAHRHHRGAGEGKWPNEVDFWIPGVRDGDINRVRFIIVGATDALCAGGPAIPIVRRIVPVVAPAGHVDVDADLRVRRLHVGGVGVDDVRYDILFVHVGQGVVGNGGVLFLLVLAAVD